MGIPSFYRWLVERYPLAVSEVIEESPLVINGVHIPIDSSRPNPNQMEFDNLYLDMNGIIHPCFHPEGQTAPNSYDEVFISVFKYIDRIFLIIRPRKLLYLAIDGVAPRAKRNQQRARRFRAARDAVEADAKGKMLRNAFEKERQNLDSLQSDKLDSNIITPGTEFMSSMSSALRYYIHLRMNSDPGWSGIKVILSDASVVGEGEHKIMAYIRLQRNCEGFDPNTRHCLYGLDADLIMLALATHEIHFSILREDVSNPRPKKMETSRKWNVYRRTDQEKRVKSESDDYISRQKFQFFNIWILRDYLSHEMKIPDPTVSADLERLMDDFIFMCLLIGNDFLPHVPSLEISEGAIDLLMTVYKKEFIQMGGYLTDSYKVNLKRVQHFMRAVGCHEDPIFRRRRQVHNERSRRYPASNAKRGSAGALDLRLCKRRKYEAFWSGSNLIQNSTDQPAPCTDAKELQHAINTATKDGSNYIVDNRELGEEGLKEGPYPDKFEAKTEHKREKIQKHATDAKELQHAVNSTTKDGANDLVDNRELGEEGSKEGPYPDKLEVKTEDKREKIQKHATDAKELQQAVKSTTKDGANDIADNRELGEEGSKEGPYPDKFEAKTEDKREKIQKHATDAKELQQAVNSTTKDGANDIVDNIKLGEEGWKERFYAEKFEAKTEDERENIRKHAVLKYMEGMCWVMHYYYEGVCSWEWFYPYHYAPFASDFYDIEDLEILFTPGNPLKPFDQLMGVLPPASAHALPLHYRELMTDPSSPILDLYPSDFELDMNGKRHEWQAICKLPFLEESRLLAEIAKVEHTLTEEEKQRNSVGMDVLFVHIRHPLASEIIVFFERNKDHPKLSKIKVKRQIDPKFSDGMNGFMYLSDIPILQPEISSLISDMDAITSNQVITVFYRLPTCHPHIPRLPEGVFIPEMAVRKEDIVTTSVLWYEKSGFLDRVSCEKVIPNAVSDCSLQKLAHVLVLKYYVDKKKEYVDPRVFDIRVSKGIPPARPSQRKLNIWKNQEYVYLTTRRRGDRPVQPNSDSEKNQGNVDPTPTQPAGYTRVQPNSDSVKKQGNLDQAPTLSEGKCGDSNQVTLIRCEEKGNGRFKNCKRKYGSNRHYWPVSTCPTQPNSIIKETDESDSNKRQCLGLYSEAIDRNEAMILQN